MEEDGREVNVVGWEFEIGVRRIEWDLRGCRRIWKVVREVNANVKGFWKPLEENWVRGGWEEYSP